MRDIKFRAYVKDKKKIYDVKEIDFVNKLIRFEEEGKPTDTMRMLDQVELMQYTGMKDHNGKEIYEGDIINANGVANAEVQYDEFDAEFVLYFGADGVPVCVEESDEYSIKVLGNKYDNPELLKGIR